MMDLPRLWRRLFNLRGDEIAPASIAAAMFFCVMTALMLLRPARDAFGLELGIERVRTLIAVTAVATLVMTPLFGWWVGRLKRLQLVAVTYGGIVLTLVGFWGMMTFAADATRAASALLFYVWFNVFNLFVTTVFWALLADRFDSEQGQRVFALISTGGTLGAIFGPWLTTRLAAALGTQDLLLVASASLLLAIVAASGLLRQPRIAGQAPAARVAVAETPVGGSAWGGIGPVLRSPYLAGIAGYVMLTSVVATFVYFTRLQMVAGLADNLDARAVILARIDMWTHIAVLLLQLTLTQRIIKRFGLGVTLALLPVTSALGFAGLAIYGSFLGLILLEAGTRAVQRGCIQPAREALFTVLGREDTYKAKAVVDTFIYRAGDVAGAQAEGMLGRLGVASTALVSVVLPLSLVWGLLALWLGREHVRRARRVADADDVTGPDIVDIAPSAPPAGQRATRTARDADAFDAHQASDAAWHARMQDLDPRSRSTHRSGACRHPSGRRVGSSRTQVK